MKTLEHATTFPSTNMKPFYFRERGTANSGFLTGRVLLTMPCKASAFPKRKTLSAPSVSLERAMTIRFYHVPTIKVPSISRRGSRNRNPYRRWRTLHQERRTPRPLSVSSNRPRTRRSALSDRHSNADNLHRLRSPTAWVLHQPGTNLDLPEIPKQCRRTLHA